MTDPVVRIRNWKKWQSYRSDRGQPPWIKLHRALMRDPNWVALSDADRGQLVAIWLLAADRDGIVPASPAMLKKLCYMDSEPNLELLTEQGFIEPRRQRDAKVTPKRRQRADEVSQSDAPETETETEKSREETEKKLLRVVTEELDVLWSIHGRGTKHKAATELKKALKIQTHERIKSQLIAYTQTFRPDFQGAALWRWLRDRRWEEDYAPSKGSSSLQDRYDRLGEAFDKAGIR